MKEATVGTQNKDKDDRIPTPQAKVTVVLDARPLDEGQTQRLNTAVDALLAEWVRQELSRAKAT